MEQKHEFYQDFYLDYAKSSLNHPILSIIIHDTVTMLETVISIIFLKDHSSVNEMTAFLTFIQFQTFLWLQPVNKHSNI